MPHSSTVSFLSYWRSLQIDPEKAPSREQFDPARLKSLIPQMIMISTAEPGHRFRLSGGFLRTLHGYELKDTSFLALFRPAFVDTIVTALGIGVIEGLTKVFYSEASTTVIFVVMALVLLLRPKGLFGREGAA